MTWLQRDLGDVHPVLSDQLQQQVERAVEIVEADDERADLLLDLVADCHRAITSRASARYACAAGDAGA